MSRRECVSRYELTSSASAKPRERAWAPSAALAAHARSRGFALADEVSAYLLNHARRDMGSLIAALDSLDRYSLETGRAITVPLLKAALA